MNSIRNLIAKMDGLVRLTHVSQPQRRRVIGAQINGLLEMTPLGAVGALMSLLIIIHMMWGTSVSQYVNMLAAAIILFQGLALRAYFLSRKRSANFEAGSRSIRRVAINGAIFGGLWGAMVVLIVPTVPTNGLLIAGILLSSILLTAIYCFRTVVQGWATFIGVSSLFLAYLFFSEPELVGFYNATGLLAAYLTIIPAGAMLQTREFVDSFIGELQSQESAEISDVLLKRFEETGHEWFWATDENGYLERASEEFRDVLSFVDSGFNDAKAEKRLADCDSDEQSGLAVLLDKQEDFEGIRVKLRMRGEDHWVALSGRRNLRSDGSFAGFIGVCSDVTKEKLNEQKIVEMAMVDGLTGLHNRTSFYDQLDMMVRRIERYGTPFSLLFLDLDKFKLVNDSYGHHVGDALLREAANRILSTLRENDVVGRLGGDEFGIIVEETSDPVFIAKLATRIIQEVAAPYEVENETLYIGVSVGVALAPVHGTQREQLLRNADLALYRAKDDGRGVFRYFEAQMDFEQRERRMLEQEMRQALTENEFEMKFQPMISTASGRVVCMEALIRWNHEIRGLLSPDEFISIAEQSNLIVEVGRWSLASACNTAQTWPENVCVAVNISAMHFMRADIVSDVREVLRTTGLAPARLELEITESILIEHNDDTVTKLHGLRELGLSIAMDDFGTGYSSLGYLTKFRFDRLKIDKSFLMDMESNEDRKAIIYTISTLGENLGINITVEGVETIEHVNFLKTITCDQAQGYYYSKPIHADEVASFLLRTFTESISDQSESAKYVRTSREGKKVANLSK